MKEFNEKNYPNFLNKISLSSKEMFDILKNYPLFFPKYKNEIAEHKVKWPLFVESLLLFIETNKTFPKQEEFYNFYINNNPDFFNNHKYDDDVMRGLKCRVYRSYASLIRDVHFSQYSKEKFTEGNIVYNGNVDSTEGIDVMFIYKTNNWGVALYVNTPDALKERARKLANLVKFDNVIYHDLPLEFKGSVKCGDFYLYGNREYNEIYNKILKTDKE